MMEGLRLCMSMQEMPLLIQSPLRVHFILALLTGLRVVCKVRGNPRRWTSALITLWVNSCNILTWACHSSMTSLIRFSGQPTILLFSRSNWKVRNKKSHGWNLICCILPKAGNETGCRTPSAINDCITPIL